MSDLRIDSITFANFRNYGSLSLENLGKLTIFAGYNAVGKTNILEGIQLLTSTSSFRHPQNAQLVRSGCDGGRISLEATDGNRQLEMSLVLEAGKRRYAVNGKAKATADIRGLLPSVMFTPDDLQLAKKSSSAKRTALDDLGVQLTRNYYLVRRDYEKTVRYKNRLLKEEASKALLESINETLLTCGSQLQWFRMMLFNRMIPHVARVYSQLVAGEKNHEEFTASYKPSWDRLSGGQGANSSADEGKDPNLNAATFENKHLEPKLNRDEIRKRMAVELEQWLDEERQRSRCLIGPHNDEITFYLARRDVSTFASQGQQRSVVLAWKLSEVEVTRETMGVHPVLLLDDVLSELDASRREMLVRFVTEDMQTFMTATDLDGFSPELLERARVVNLPLTSGVD